MSAVGKISTGGARSRVPQTWEQWVALLGLPHKGAARKVATPAAAGAAAPAAGGGGASMPVKVFPAAIDLLVTRLIAGEGEKGKDEVESIRDQVFDDLIQRVGLARGRKDLIGLRQALRQVEKKEEDPFREKAAAARLALKGPETPAGAEPGEGAALRILRMAKESWAEKTARNAEEFLMRGRLEIQLGLVLLLYHEVTRAREKAGDKAGSGFKATIPAALQEALKEAKINLEGLAGSGGDAEKKKTSGPNIYQYLISELEGQVQTAGEGRGADPFSFETLMRVMENGAYHPLARAAARTVLASLFIWQQNRTQAAIEVGLASNNTELKVEALNALRVFSHSLEAADRQPLMEKAAEIYLETFVEHPSGEQLAVRKTAERTLLSITAERFVNPHRRMTKPTLEAWLVGFVEAKEADADGAWHQALDRLLQSGRLKVKEPPASGKKIEDLPSPPKEAWTEFIELELMEASVDYVLLPLIYESDLPKDQRQRATRVAEAMASDPVWDRLVKTLVPRPATQAEKEAALAQFFLETATKANADPQELAKEAVLTAARIAGVEVEVLPGKGQPAVKARKEKKNLKHCRLVVAVVPESEDPRNPKAVTEKVSIVEIKVNAGNLHAFLLGMDIYKNVLQVFGQGYKIVIQTDLGEGTRNNILSAAEGQIKGGIRLLKRSFRNLSGIPAAVLLNQLRDGGKNFILLCSSDNVLVIFDKLRTTEGLKMAEAMEKHNCHLVFFACRAEYVGKANDLFKYLEQLGQIVIGVRGEIVNFFEKPKLAVLREGKLDYVREAKAAGLPKAKELAEEYLVKPETAAGRVFKAICKHAEKIGGEAVDDTARTKLLSQMETDEKATAFLRELAEASKTAEGKDKWAKGRGGALGLSSAMAKTLIEIADQVLYTYINTFYFAASQDLGGLIEYYYCGRTQGNTGRKPIAEIVAELDFSKRLSEPMQEPTPEKLRAQYKKAKKDFEAKFKDDPTRRFGTLEEWTEQWYIARAVKLLSGMPEYITNYVFAAYRTQFGDSAKQLYRYLSGIVRAPAGVVFAEEFEAELLRLGEFDCAKVLAGLFENPEEKQLKPKPELKGEKARAAALDKLTAEAAINAEQRKRIELCFEQLDLRGGMVLVGVVDFFSDVGTHLEVALRAQDIFNPNLTLRNLMRFLGGVSLRHNIEKGARFGNIEILEDCFELKDQDLAEGEDALKLRTVGVRVNITEGGETREERIEITVAEDGSCTIGGVEIKDVAHTYIDGKSAFSSGTVLDHHSAFISTIVSRRKGEEPIIFKPYTLVEGAKIRGLVKFFGDTERAKATETDKEKQGAFKSILLYDFVYGWKEGTEDGGEWSEEEGIHGVLADTVTARLFLFPGLEALAEVPLAQDTSDEKVGETDPVFGSEGEEGYPLLGKTLKVLAAQGALRGVGLSLDATKNILKQVQDTRIWALLPNIEHGLDQLKERASP